VKRQSLGLLCAAAAVLIAPAATPVAAQTAHHSAAPSGGNDVRCLIFAMNMASSQDQGAKTVGFLGVAYYLGKIDASGRSAGLEAHMETEITQMKEQKIAPGPIAQACGQELSGRMQAVSAAGQQLQQKFAPQGAAPAAQAPMTLKPIPSPGSH